MLAIRDKARLIKVLSHSVARLARLYQVPGWDELASVELAEWIYDTYKWDACQDVVQCLRKPPVIRDDKGAKITNWRLTPETVERWMDAHLQKAAEARENEHHNRKVREPEDVDYAEVIEQYKEKSTTTTWVTESDFEEFKRRVDGIARKPLTPEQIEAIKKQENG